MQLKALDKGVSYHRVEVEWMPSIMAADSNNSNYEFTQLILSLITNSISTALTQLQKYIL